MWNGRRHPPPDRKNDELGGVAVVISIVAVGIWKGWPLLKGSSIGQLFTTPAALILIPLIVVVVGYFLIAFTGFFGGMWVTRNVKHTNRYGIEQDSFPKKHPKIWRPKRFRCQSSAAPRP